MKTQVGGCPHCKDTTRPGVVCAYCHRPSANEKMAKAHIRLAHQVDPRPKWEDYKLDLETIAALAAEKMSEWELSVIEQELDFGESPRQDDLKFFQMIRDILEGGEQDGQGGTSTSPGREKEPEPATPLCKHCGHPWGQHSSVGDRECFHKTWFDMPRCDCPGFKGER